MIPATDRTERAEQVQNTDDIERATHDLVREIASANTFSSAARARAYVLDVARERGLIP